MNALNRIALLAGGALVAAAATGCSSSTKAAASGSPAASSPNASGAPAAPVTVTVSGQASGSSAPAGGGTTAPAANGSSSTAANGGSATAPPAAAPTAHPVCDNAHLNVALAPAVSGQKASVAVIAVKNVGPTCTVGPIPYLWIVASPTDASNETRPLVPSTDSSKKNIILSGTTLYAAVDLNPDSAASAAGGYGYLAVTANPTKDTSGKDVQNVQLPAPANVSNAMLSVYALSPASAIDQIQYATTPER